MRKDLEEIKEKYANVPEAQAIIEEVVDAKEKEFYKNHQSVSETKDYTDYSRHLIQLNHDTAMMIHLFKKDPRHAFEEVWLDDNEKCCEAEYNCITDSAHQLILQLEGHWCEAFIEALRNECNQILEDCNKRKEEIQKRFESLKKD